MPLMGRTVAVKVLPRDKSTPEAIANFTREIQALAKLNHGRIWSAPWTPATMATSITW